MKVNFVFKRYMNSLSFSLIVFHTVNLLIFNILKKSQFILKNKNILVKPYFPLAKSILFCLMEIIFLYTFISSFRLKHISYTLMTFTFFIINDFYEFSKLKVSLNLKNTA